MLRFLFLEQESTAFAQSIGAEEEETQGKFLSRGASHSCLHGEPRLLSTLKVIFSFRGTTSANQVIQGL